MQRNPVTRSRVSTALVGTALLSLTLGLAACGSSTATTAPSVTSTSGLVATPTGAGSASGSAPGSQSPVAVESNPPGDIPDNIAYVAYTNNAGRYSFTHPEGWAQTGSGTSVMFTDKLNGVTVDVGAATAPPTVATANQQDVPALKSSQPAFELKEVSAVTGTYGSGVLIVYRRNSAPDPVTGRQYRDEVQRYEVVSGGREVVMELFGPVGADNVDAYHQMITSLVIA